MHGKDSLRNRWDVCLVSEKFFHFFFFFMYRVYSFDIVHITGSPINRKYVFVIDVHIPVFM